MNLTEAKQTLQLAIDFLNAVDWDSNSTEETAANISMALDELYTALDNGFLR